MQQGVMLHLRSSPQALYTASLEPLHSRDLSPSHGPGPLAWYYPPHVAGASRAPVVGRI